MYVLKMKFLTSAVQKLSSEQTHRWTDRQTDRQTDRWTDRQTDTHTHGQTDRLDWNYYLPHTRMVKIAQWKACKIRILFFRSPTKLREGNVFSRFCLFTRASGPMWPLQTCLLLLRLGPWAIERISYGHEMHCEFCHFVVISQQN